MENTRAESGQMEKSLRGELERLKTATSITTISMKDEKMNDMEDELANALSSIERFKYQQIQSIEEQKMLENALQTSETKRMELETRIETLTPLELTPEEVQVKEEEERLADELKRNEEEQLSRLLSCVEYFAQTGLPALEDACDASQLLHNTLVQAAPRAMYAASGSTQQSSTNGANKGALLRRIVDDRLNEQEDRHRSEILELEKTSGDALNSMARGWSEAEKNTGRDLHNNNTMYLNGSNANNHQDNNGTNGMNGMTGQGPQVELFIWKAAMKHAEDLRKVQSSGHRECTQLRSSLAIEAETLESSAQQATVLREHLIRLRSAFDQELHTKTESTVLIENTEEPSPFLLAQQQMAPENINMLLSASDQFKPELKPTLHDFDNRSKPYSPQHTFQPPSNSPPPMPSIQFQPIGPPIEQPPPGVNPLFEATHR